MYIYIGHISVDMYNTIENAHLLDIFQIPGAVSGGVERHPRHPPAYGPGLYHKSEP